MEQIFNVSVLSPLKVVGDKRPSGKATILDNTSNAYMFLKYWVGTLKCILWHYAHFILKLLRNIFLKII